MRACAVCGLDVDHDRAKCSLCASVADIVAMVNRPVLVVDGSYQSGRAGAGLVLAEAFDGGRVLAYTFCVFQAHDATEAEYQAIVRGARWAPGITVWSDCLGAIYRAKVDHHAVKFLPRDMRHHHGLAHRLSVRGRRQAQPLARCA